MTAYRATVTITRAGDLTLGTKQVLDTKLTDIGFISSEQLNGDTLTYVWDVEADDLWELRDKVGEIEDEISSLGFDCTIPRPVEYKKAERG